MKKIKEKPGVEPKAITLSMDMDSLWIVYGYALCIVYWYVLPMDMDSMWICIVFGYGESMDIDSLWVLGMDNLWMSMDIRYGYWIV